MISSPTKTLLCRSCNALKGADQFLVGRRVCNDCKYARERRNLKGLRGDWRNNLLRGWIR